MRIPISETGPIVEEASKALGVFRETAAKEVRNFSHLLVVPNSEAELAARLKDVRLFSAENRTAQHVALSNLSIVDDSGRVKSAVDMIGSSFKGKDMPLGDHSGVMVGYQPGKLSLANTFVDPADLVGESGSIQRMQQLLKGDLNYAHEYERGLVSMRNIGIYMPGGFRSFDDALAAVKSHGMINSGSNMMSENPLGEMSPLSVAFANPTRIFESGHESANFKTVLDVKDKPNSGIDWRSMRFDTSNPGKIKNGPSVPEPDSFVGLGALSNPYVSQFKGNERNALARGIAAFAEEKVRLTPLGGKDAQNVARDIAHRLSGDDVGVLSFSMMEAPNVDRLIEASRLHAWRGVVLAQSRSNPAVETLPGWTRVGGTQGVAMYSQGLAQGMEVDDVALASVKIAPHIATDRVQEIMQTLKGVEDPDLADAAVVKLGIAHAAMDAARYRSIIDAPLARART